MDGGGGAESGSREGGTGDGGGRSDEPRHLVVGQVTKAHGTKGEVFVWPLTDRPDEVFAVGAAVIAGDDAGRTADGAEVVVQSSRPFKRGLLVRFEGIADRDAAEELAGRYVLVPVERLSPLEEGEVYYHQLLGAEVVTVDGETIGRVREVYETEPAHLLEVTGLEKVHLIPFTERIVRRVDVQGGQLVIEPPPGLLEL